MNDKNISVIYDKVAAELQKTEELHGLDRAEYLRLMRNVASMAISRMQLPVETLQDLTAPSWEKMYAYETVLHPHHLVTLTTADANEFTRLVHALPEDRNIAEWLTSNGFFAVTGNFTGVTVRL